MAVMAIIIITGGVMAVIMVMVAAAVVITPGKGSEKNPEKSFPRRERGVPSGLPTQKETRVGVIGAPLDTLPA